MRADERPSPPNTLGREFHAERPNQRWIADFTYIWTAEGWLYVAAVIDLFSRRVVGWSMKAEMTAGLVTDALMMAIWRRGNPRTAVLGEEGRHDLYGAEHEQVLRWYRYLFLGRGKPSTHVRVLSNQTSEALTAEAPEELRALLTSISARLAPPPPALPPQNQQQPPAA